MLKQRRILKEIFRRTNITKNLIWNTKPK